MSSRNNVVEMPSQVPAGMADWVDSMVLMCVSLVDSEFCAQLSDDWIFDGLEFHK